MKRESGPDSCIKVAIRCRPFLPFEESSKSSCVTFLSSRSIKIESPESSADSNRHTYTFDDVFHGTTKQNEIYIRSVRPLVDACLEGFNATILAYGQTGSGKTHTMLGKMSELSGVSSSINPEEDTSDVGLLPRAIRSLFSRLDDLKQEFQLSKSSEYSYKVSIQFLELYGENIRDLLHPESTQDLKIRDSLDEPEVLNSKTFPVDNAQEALMHFTRGMLRRVTRATSMNQHSSRSHAIMTVMLEQCIKTPVMNPNDQQHVMQTITKRSKFHFVDLAGSERMKRTHHSSDVGVKEGININKGLLVLGNVISALASQKLGREEDNFTDTVFVPYRDSKLTRLLRGSIGGNHKTLMIACISPCSSCEHESINTLRYANRAKNIQNRAIVNIDAGSAVISTLRENMKLMAIELLRVRKLVPKTVKIDTEGSIFTFAVLLALANGENLDLSSQHTDISSPRKGVNTPKEMASIGSPQSVTDFERNLPRWNEITENKIYRVSTQQKKSRFEELRSSISRSTSSQNDLEIDIQESKSLDAVVAELEKAKSEIQRLKRALEKADDRVIDTQQRLVWTEDELKAARDEIIAFADMHTTEAEDNDYEEENELDTSDFNMPLLNQETFEMVKDIYEEKLMQMAFAIQDYEEDRENIAMQLHRHDSDSSRLLYLKTMLAEDLKKKENEIAELKLSLKDISSSLQPGNQSSIRGVFPRQISQQRAQSISIAPGITSAYYKEKLDSLEKHISVREAECTSLSQEIEKIQTDSVLFTDMIRDLENRLRIKNEEIKSMEKTKQSMKTVDAVRKINSCMVRDLEERSKLTEELDRVKNDSSTLSALLTALISEKDAKIAQIEKYRAKYSEHLQKVGLSEEDMKKLNDRTDISDEESANSFSTSLSSLNLFGSSRSVGRSSSVSNGLAKKEFNSRVSQIESQINKCEEDHSLLRNELNKIESDAFAFGELSSALKSKLKQKEEQIEQLKEKYEEFKATLRKQEMELKNLAEGSFRGKEESQTEERKSEGDDQISIEVDLR